MNTETSSGPTRRAFAKVAAGVFTIVPRHVLGGQGQVAPSDQVTVAAVGMGRQGMTISMDLLARPDVRIVAVCDCNEGSLDYAEYGENALLKQARELLGKGYEQWGADLASPGFKDLTDIFRTSLGMGDGFRRSVLWKLTTRAAAHRARTKAAASMPITGSSWRKRRAPTRYTWRRRTTGMRPSPSHRCARESTYSARSR